MTKYIEVPLLPKSPTAAAKNRMQKINLYVLDNPGCSFSDIYRNSKATKNRNDLKEDINHLVSTGDLIYIESIQKFFREPIKKDHKKMFSINQVMDEIAKMDKSASLQNTKLFKLIKETSPRINASNVGKILDVYESSIDLENNINDQLLSKAFIVFFQKTRIFSSEIKGIELKKDEKGKIVCAAMTVYKASPEEYTALISIEAWEKLQEYKKIWIKKMSRPPADSDPLILERLSKPVPVTASTVKSRINKLVLESGLRVPLTEGKRRHDVPATHGFRRYWDKVMMQTKSTKGTLSALVIKERLLGHYGLVKTDKNYFWTDILEHVPEYLGAMPELMISDEYRLRGDLEKERLENQRLVNVNRQKEQALSRLAELEAKVERMQKYQIK